MTDFVKLLWLSDLKKSGKYNQIGFPIFGFNLNIRSVIYGPFFLIFALYNLDVWKYFLNFAYKDLDMENQAEW